MAPTSIDGTEITGATIDGQDVSEITVDGETVFTAIPDSAIYYWDPGNFASPWTDEVIGEDMTINGGLSSNTFSDGSDAVLGDGVDDYGTAGATDIFYNSMSLEIELSTTTTSVDFPFGLLEGTAPGELIYYIYLNQDGNFNDDDGRFTLFISDGGGIGALAFSYNLPFNDGNKHKVSFIINDAAQNDVDMIVDGQSVTPSLDRANGPNISGKVSSVNPMYFARNVDGPQDYFSGKLGKIVHHDEAITKQTI